MSDIGDLAAFITARLDETARLARDSHPDLDIPESGDWAGAENGETGCAVCETGRAVIAARIARNDPARALRAVPALRAILAQWQQSRARPAVLYQLAAVYADHPDYRPEWATET